MAADESPATPVTVMCSSFAPVTRAERFAVSVGPNVCVRRLIPPADISTVALASVEESGVNPTTPVSVLHLPFRSMARGDGVGLIDESYDCIRVLDRADGRLADREARVVWPREIDQ
jgi:hypothetical protein